MTLRELLEKMDIGKIAIELSDDFLSNEIAKDKIDRNILIGDFESAIGEMLNLPFVRNDGSELVVLKIVDYGSENESDRFEILLKKPNDRERYGIEMILWQELIDLKIADLSIAKYAQNDIAKAILQGMTFMGISVESQTNRVGEEIEILTERIENETYEDAEPIDKFLKRLGFEPHKETEEEKELRQKRLKDAIMKNNAIYIEFGFSPIPVK